MTNIKRLVLIALTAVISSSALSGCGNTDEITVSNDEIIITFETHRTDMADSTIKELADKYNKENPNIKIEIEAVKDSDNIMKTRAAAGELPDLSDIPANTPVNDLPLYYAPLDDLGFTKDNLYGYEFGVSSDGKLYGLNQSINYSGIIYNKKAFKDARITSVPRTLDEFYAACEKLKAKGIIPFASNFKDKWPLQQFGDSFVIAIEMTGDNEYKNTLINTDLFSNPKGIKFAFDFLRNMKEKGYLESDLMSTNWDSMKKDHASGKIAMTCLGTWYPVQLVQNGANKEDIGMFPFPGVKVLSQSGDYRFGIFKNSEHIKETKDFLKWLYEDQKYQKALNIVSPLKEAKISDPAIAELTSFGLSYLQMKPSSPEVDEAIKVSQIDFSQALQEYIIAEDPQLTLKKYSEKWNSVKKRSN